jgi:hypothetical protein
MNRVHDVVPLTNDNVRSLSEPVDVFPQPVIEKLRRASQISVTIHVEMFNPALALYERLGFRKLREFGVYHFMEWSREPQPDK